MADEALAGRSSPAWTGSPVLVSQRLPGDRQQRSPVKQAQGGHRAEDTSRAEEYAGSGDTGCGNGDVRWPDTATRGGCAVAAHRSALMLVATTAPGADST